MPGTLRLRPLAPILGAALAPTIHPSRIERPADNMVADARQVLDTAAANEHNRVLLQRMTLARDVSRDLDPVRQPHAGHLAQRRIRFLRRLRAHLGADPPLLRGALRLHQAALLHRVKGVLQRRRLGPRLLERPPLAHELVDRRHESPPQVPGDLAQSPIASKGGHRTCAMASPRPIPYSTRAGRQPTPARVCRQTDRYSTMPERRPSRNFARLRALEIGPSATPPARPEAHPPASTAQKSSPPLLSLSPASRGRHRIGREKPDLDGVGC